jgi:hypothetical protein
MRWIVSFEVDAPDGMDTTDILNVVNDAMAESWDRNREDETHPEIDFHAAQIEPAE